MENSTVDMDYDATTEFDYGTSAPCEKYNVKALATQLLPPLYSLVFIVGLVGNVVVALILIKYKRLRIVTNIYLLNLAFSDLLFLFTLPFWIHTEVKSEWVFGNSMCKFVSGLYYMGLYSEIFFIVLLTVDRYLAIVHAVFALQVRTVNFGIMTSAVTWGLAGLAALPSFVFSTSQRSLENHVCSPVYPDAKAENWKHFRTLKMNLLGLIFPMIVMVVCYAGIIKKLLKCRNEKKYKAVRLIFVIMIVFFLFWTPYNLVLLLNNFQMYFFEGECEKSKQLDIAMQVTEVITFIHCCANPVIYAFVGERFQKYLCHFFRRRMAVKLGKHIPLFPCEKLERVSSVTPSTGEQDLSGGF
ncbi:C-C chemokine receptor type 3-like [Ornithorhynchus anatinus]|uniref:C-C motif chemokine receptor 3 n=1 Tax=Ornithorhynchus anatinus TaxID=9258 RepID=F6X7U2_ORNAN|nr:C-C chemokine receptor type 3-like [Ornithorhynchus anatinus]XP_007664342.1 C-C chemokine receptor type 3-like [Ornithorhynchus anatinus]